MTAQIVKLQLTIDQMVTEVHKNFATEREAGNRADRARIRCGQLLLSLRARIEAGEAGNEGWWGWYKANIVRSRRDGERVMKIARDENPEAALEAERADTRDAVARHRERTATYSKSDSDADQSEHRAAGARCAPHSDANPDDDDGPVEQALKLVDKLAENMTFNQRRRFFAALRSRYADQD